MDSWHGAAQYPAGSSWTSTRAIPTRNHPRTGLSPGRIAQNIDVSETPIFFVEIGARGQSGRGGEAGEGRGFFLNMAVLPAVPHGRAGIRFAVTLQHRLEDIELMLETLATAYRSVMNEERVVEFTDRAEPVPTASPQ